MSSAKIEDKFSALELARAAALEDSPAPDQVGELVSIDKQKIIVARDFLKDDEIRGAIVIPRENIISM
jgi:hypothetical protein